MALSGTIPPEGGYNSAKAAAAAPTRPNPEATNWAAAPVVGFAVAIVPVGTDPEVHPFVSFLGDSNYQGLT